MKYYILLAVIFFSNDCCTQQNAVHDLNKLTTIADSALVSKFGECIFKKHIRLKNIEIIEEERDYTHKIPDYILATTHTNKVVNYVLSYSFLLDKEEISQIDIHLNERAEIQRGGAIKYFSTDRNLEGNCDLISHFSFRGVERKILELHKIEAPSTKITLYNNIIALESSSFLNAEDILITHFSLETGDILSKQIYKFIP